MREWKDLKYMHLLHCMITNEIFEAVTSTEQLISYICRPIFVTYIITTSIITTMTSLDMVSYDVTATFFLQ